LSLQLDFSPNKFVRFFKKNGIDLRRRGPDPNTNTNTSASPKWSWDFRISRFGTSIR
jgi:hypothetical protein